ncbi:DUF6538 domain-containing protein [Sphingobium sp. DN12]|uniref:DUF6538 domain-containing protein n=1 Tax=Sphingobium sp. DN12 TaxID=3378073 RepID=UPI003DA65412
MVSPKRPQGLWRRGAIYQYRVRVPHDLIGSVGLTRVNRSLKTSSFHEAVRVARRVAYEIELEFVQVRCGVEPTTFPADRQQTVRPTIVPVVVSKTTDRTIRDAIDGYMTDPTRSRTVKSEAVYRTTFATIAAILGSDTLLKDIDRDRCRDLLTVLQRLPSNAKKRFPSLTPREAAEHAVAHEVAPMSSANVNEYMNKLSTLFNWALREEWISRNPANGLRIAKATVKSDQRKPFSTDQLNRIFHSPLYSGCRDDENGYAIEGDARPRRARFWIPLIGLYTGARLNEICQLHTADVRQVDDVWCFDLRADPASGKNLKTAGSQRLVPIHPMLKEIGILAYLRERHIAGDQRLFPEIATDAFGLHSGRVSRWFSRFLTTCGASSRGVCFHSFRHTFRDALREAKVEREVALRLGGWAESGGSATVVGDGYGSGFSPSRLEGAISAINFAGLDLSYLSGESTLNFAHGAYGRNMRDRIERP